MTTCPTARPPKTGVVARTIGIGAAVGGAVGGVAGLIIGAATYLPTVWAAIIEGGCLGVVPGAVLAVLGRYLVIGTVRTLRWVRR